MDLSNISLWSISELKQRLQAGLNPNTVINNFLRVYLIHVWARQGSIAHLTVLYYAGANFNNRTRQGYSVYDELLLQWDKTKDDRYTQCIDWLRQHKVTMDE